MADFPNGTSLALLRRELARLGRRLAFQIGPLMAQVSPSYAPTWRARALWADLADLGLDPTDEPTPIHDEAGAEQIDTRIRTVRGFSSLRTVRCYDAEGRLVSMFRWPADVAFFPGPIPGAVSVEIEE